MLRGITKQKIQRTKILVTSTNLSKPLQDSEIENST